VGDAGTDPVVLAADDVDGDGDPDPMRWINDRNANPNLEISQHGTYHANNTPFGDWANQPDRFFFSCDECGFSLEAVFQYLRVGRRTLLGEYGVDPWIQQSGADPATSDRIDWSDAANPLIGYAPPFNASDPASREAEARLGFRGFSASAFEETSPIFTPEESHMENFDSLGMFHASADVEVDSEAPPGMSYRDFLESLTQAGGLNTWLIEEVSWSTRYCNDLERLEPCPAAPGGVNRENNMVDPARWDNWLTLLDYVNESDVVLTLGEYALAVATDNCATVANADQADGDGNPDLVTYYRINRTGLAVGDFLACLEGTFADQPFLACDLVITGPPFPSCGLGFEVALVLPPLLWLRSRRRRSFSDPGRSESERARSARG